MRKLLLCLCFASCTNTADQTPDTSDKIYSTSDYLSEVLQYQIERENESIEVSGTPTDGYTVTAYKFDSVVYNQWSAVALDTTAMIDQAINKLNN